jgi:hypothetical protein
VTDLLSACPSCGQTAPPAPEAPANLPGGPGGDPWWGQTRDRVTGHPLVRLRPHVWLRRLVVAGHTAATIWLLFTHQVAVAELPWLGTAVAGACTVIALFISGTAIRGRWWPWLWAAAGWVAPVAAYRLDAMWPVYVSVVALPGLALWLAAKAGRDLDVRVWLFEDFARAVAAAPDDRRAMFTLYRHFDADGRLLYVGKTIRPGWKRTREHARSKDWWPHVAWSTYTRYSSADDLARAEIAAIQQERPRHNVVHSRR